MLYEVITLVQQLPEHLHAGDDRLQRRTDPDDLDLLEPQRTTGTSQDCQWTDGSTGSYNFV